jgi:hypothetical protein
MQKASHIIFQRNKNSSFRQLFDVLYYSLVEAQVSKTLGFCSEVTRLIAGDMAMSSFLTCVQTLSY